MTDVLAAAAGDQATSNIARAWGAREIDVTEVLQHLRARPIEGADASAGVPELFVIFVSAVCEALADVPYLNSRWTDEGIALLHGVNLGLEVPTGFGRVVPVVRRADTMSIDELASALTAAARRARAGQSSAHECAGGSFTAGFAGAHGSVLSRALLHDGQAGIYHVGAVRRVPRVVADAIAARQVCFASLAFDHRILDGSTSSRFQNLVKSKVESWRWPE